MEQAIILDLQTSARTRQSQLELGKHKLNAAREALRREQQRYDDEENSLRSVLSFLQEHSPETHSHGWFTEFGLDPLPRADVAPTETAKVISRKTVAKDKDSVTA